MMDFGGHLRGLLRFSGRERRTTFWLWMLICYGIQSAIGIIATQPFTAHLNERMQQYVATHPEMRPGALPPLALFTDVFPLKPLLAISAIGGVLSLLLVAAATTRRLHDTGRSGWWAAPLVVIQLAGVALVFHAYDAFLAAPGWAAVRSDAGLLALDYVAGLIFFVLLIVFCCQATHETANRYGPAPGERAG